MNKLCALLIFSLIIPCAVFSQNQDEVEKALKEHNCEVLYNFIKNSNGKESPLTVNARYVINRYTMPERAIEHYRTRTMNLRVWRPDKSLKENVFQDPQKYLPLVVKKLTEDVKDNFLKVKILHDWICYYIAYDVDTFFGKARNNQDYISVIQNRKAVCSGYAALFNQMCRLASIESMEITGYSKGYGYDEKKGASLDHAWNAVNIIGRWYLLDITWDAGNIEGSAFIGSYSTHYLFLDSGRFLIDHLPAENKYQFYAPTMTKEQFEKDTRYKWKDVPRTSIEKIAINTFEQTIIPALDTLLEKKKITKKERDYFINAHKKVPENGCYYFIEDQYSRERNDAVTRIRPRFNYLW